MGIHHFIYISEIPRYIKWTPTKKSQSHWVFMMTSSNENILLAFCEGNPLVTGGLPSQRPITRSFDVFFDLRLAYDGSNNRDASDLWSHRVHYDVIVIFANDWTGKQKGRIYNLRRHLLTNWGDLFLMEIRYKMVTYYGD